MKKTSLKALLGAGVSAFAFGAVAPAYAADLDPEPAKEYVEVCPNSGFRGAILLPGTGVCFKTGGYTKADFTATFEDFGGGAFNQANDAEALLTGAGIFNATAGDRIRGHALQTRLNFDARTTTDLGSARAFLEFDLFGGNGTETISNSANPRLRHAIVELGIDALGGSLLAGQFWTNFGDLGSYANTLDFNGPNAQVFIRQAQIRWTQPLNDTFTLSVSAENPEFTGVVLSQAATAAGLGAAAALNTGAGLDAVPDFTAALKARTSFGNFHLSGLGRYLDVDEGANLAAAGATGSTDTLFAWAIQFAGTVNVGDKDKFRFQVNYGQGQGRYIQFNGPSASVQADGSLEAVDQLGLIASYQHFWSDKLQSNLVGGYYTVTNETELPLGTQDEEIYAALNLIYSPRSNINVGVEGLYVRGETNTPGSADFDGFRLQTSFQFVF